MKNEITEGQGELFSSETQEIVPERAETAAKPEATDLSPDDKLKKQISELKQRLQTALDDLEKIEELEDRGNLPAGASWRATSLREHVESLKSQLAELDPPTPIFEVLPEEFIEKFENYYDNFKTNPETEESKRFIGIIRLIVKNREISKKLENNPKYREYLEIYN